MTMYRHVLRLLVVLMLGSVAVFATAASAGADPIGDGAGVNAVYPCDVRVINNDLYAGYESTWTRETWPGDTTWYTVEIQCLLQYLTTVRAGLLWPGPADKSFGPMTRDAVKRAQQVCQIGQDGKVGPQTWPCLRRTLYRTRPKPG
jgi:peptidoglycan hydrolase-like protein with peptidoglycan-binding domain